MSDLNTSVRNTVRRLAAQLREAGYPHQARQLVRRGRTLADVPLELGNPGRGRRTVVVRFAAPTNRHRLQPGTLYAVDEASGRLIATPDRIKHKHPGTVPEAAPLRTRTVRLSDDDWAWLQQRYGTPADGIRRAIAELRRLEEG